MEETRKLKIIQTISDYDEVNRSYVNGLAEKEEAEKADRTAKEKLEEMNLTLEEKKYAISLLADCFNRMVKSVKIPKTILDQAEAEDNSAEELEEEIQSPKDEPNFYQE